MRPGGARVTGRKLDAERGAELALSNAPYRLLLRAERAASNR